MLGKIIPWIDLMIAEISLGQECRIMSVDLDAIHADLSPPAERIRLVVSDLDGTLLTPLKSVTDASRQMVRRLQDLGVPLCLASARPPAAVMPIVKTLGLTGPSAAFNGGAIFRPDGTLEVNRVLDADVLNIILDVLHVHRVETWFLRGSTWLVEDASTGFVALDRRMTGLEPTAIPSLRDERYDIGKVVGVSNDYNLLRRIEAELGAMLKGEASVRRSAETMLDITPALANKGEGLLQLAKASGVEPHEVACLGDAQNDLSMFAVAGLSIAMGQAEEEIVAAAHFQTDTNEREGWAQAVERLILPRIQKP